MELYSSTEEFKLYHGSMLDMLEVIEPKTIDSVVTDPPYELNFMGKGWDNSGIAFQKTTWEKCYQVLKPGGYLLAFGGTRTYHRIACAIEDAGFEIRDTIMWLYGSGFPKSLNISKMIEKRAGIIKESTSTLFNNPGGKRDLSKRSDYGYVYQPQLEEAKKWNGWGTALKPAYEPIIVARKPCEGSCVDNVMKYGVGGINIDECRIYTEEDIQIHNYTQNSGIYGKYSKNIESHSSGQCRFPANVILTYDETDFEEVCGGMPETKSIKTMACDNRLNIGNSMFLDGVHSPENSYADEGSAARYYYCAKASKRDRDEGLENIQATADTAKGNGLNRICEFCGAPQLKPELCHCPVKSWVLPKRKNTHPTVKPVDLMQYLVRLVTPKGGTVLDPFNGSGSTGKAVMYENKDRGANYRYIGIELTKEYLPIAEARIRYAANDNAPIEVPQLTMAGQITFDDLLGDSVQANG